MPVCADAQDVAQALEPPDSSCAFCPRKRPFLAIGEVLLTNLFVNRVDAWAGGQAWAKTGPDDWSRNLRLGWEWDENEFGTNMFAHPYHGALYFNAGRSNGLTYWESVPLAFLGSATWEFFGEAYRPALNDFIMTSFGGITLGETFHRVAASIRDNRRHGGERLLREVVALPFDPMGGLNRLLRGEWTRTGPNPLAHDEGRYVLRLGAGWRAIADTGTTDTVTSSPTILAALDYGDRFLRPYHAPFDVFTLRAQVSPGGGGLNLLQASGRLYGTDITRADGKHRQLLEFNQRYDFVANPAFHFGAQSVEFGLASRWQMRGVWTARTDLFVDGIVLGALDAPYSGVGERTYDFGPGGGFRADVILERRGVPFLTLLGRTEYVHSVSGAEADHVVGMGGVQANVGIARGLGVALHTAYYRRTSRYTDRPREEREFPEVRLLLNWTQSVRPTSAPPAQPVEIERTEGGHMEEPPARQRNPHRSGLWGEVGSGPARIRVGCSTCTGVVVANGQGGYGRIGWSMGPKLAVGFEAFGFNNDHFGFSAGDTTITADNAHVSAIVLWYPWRRAPFFLKGGAGLAAGSYVVAADTGQALEVDATGVGLTFGLGLDVPVSRKFAITGNAAAFIAGIGDIVLPTQTVDDPIPTSYVLSVGLTYR